MRRISLTAKKHIQTVLRELQAWKIFFLSSIPGRVGIFMRSRYFAKGFGACGKEPILQRGIMVVNPYSLFIGDYFRCSVDLFINAGGTVRIGNHVILGPSVKIWSVNHRFDDWTNPIVAQGWDEKEVIIGDDVWIGANAILLPGARIGQGSVVSAGSVLSKPVPEFSIIAGNPGRIIGDRRRPRNANTTKFPPFKA
jgi:maltose O-acetyltransferase